jgi:hypothetical protein
LAIRYPHPADPRGGGLIRGFLAGRCTGTARALIALKHGSKTLRRMAMLMTIFVVLLILWLLGMVSAYTMGGFIHILLVVAIAVILIRIIQGRKPI